MTETIRTQTDLDRVNIQVAWSMADKLTSEQYDQLCRVTVEQWRREGVARTIDDPNVVLHEVVHG